MTSIELFKDRYNEFASKVNIDEAFYCVCKDFIENGKVLQDFCDETKGLYRCDEDREEFENKFSIISEYESMNQLRNA